MRGHAVCSGRLSRCRTFRSGKRRARAPGNHKGRTLLLLPAARPRELAAATPADPRECPRRVTPLLHRLLVRVSRLYVSARPRSSRVCRLWLRLRRR
jgi:hypothetical protein